MTQYNVTYKYTDYDGCDLQVDTLCISSDENLSGLLTTRQHECITQICRDVVALSPIYAPFTVQLLKIDKQEQGSYFPCSCSGSGRVSLSPISAAISALM